MMVELSDSDFYSDYREILEMAMRRNKEFFCHLISYFISKPERTLIYDVWTEFVFIMVSEKDKYSNFFFELWKKN